MTKQLTRSIELTLATKNPGKLKEFEAMASNLATEQPLNLLWHMAPDDFDPEETGDTFTANAVIKAARAAEMTGRLSLADDSGLTVDAMDGRPGIYSARYCAGTDRDRRLKLLDELKDVPQAKDRQPLSAPWPLWISPVRLSTQPK
jgi:XTP/dITP diphosphohydrolase